MKIIYQLLFLLLLTAPTALHAQPDTVKKQQQQTNEIQKYTKGYPVNPFHDTLFYVYNRMGSFSAQDRAAAISNRIIKLSGNYGFKPDSVKLSVAELTVDVIYQDNMLVSVSDQDAALQHITKQQLAEKNRGVIVKAIVKHQQETNWKTLLQEGLLALLVIAIVGLLIYVVNRFFRWVIKWIIGKKESYIKGIHIKNYELLNADNELRVLSSVLKLIKWALVVVVVYLALPVLFGIFPFTRDISNTLLGYIISPLKNIGAAVWNYIPNLITILVLVVIFRYVLRFFRFIKTEIETGRLSIPGFYADWANPTYQIVRVLVLAFMVIVIYPYMPGSDSPIFKGVSVFVGVIFTFGSSGALGNVVAGLVLTYMRAFKLGDRVKIGEVTGDVISKSLLVTRVRTIQNEIISIPNSNVMNNHTVNYSSDAPERGLIINTTVTIGYDAPWRQVHQLLIAAALDTPMIDASPEPYVLQVSLDDYYVSYRLNAYTKEPNRQAVIYSALHANIQDHFNKAGVEIMSPHYKALRDGNATTIPGSYLPKDYTPPPFKTQQQNKD